MATKEHGARHGNLRGGSWADACRKTGRGSREGAPWGHHGWEEGRRAGAGRSARTSSRHGRHRRNLSAQEDSIGGDAGTPAQRRAGAAAEGERRLGVRRLKEVPQPAVENDELSTSERPRTMKRGQGRIGTDTKRRDFFELNSAKDEYAGAARRKGLSFAHAGEARGQAPWMQGEQSTASSELSRQQREPERKELGAHQGSSARHRASRGKGLDAGRETVRHGHGWEGVRALWLCGSSEGDKHQ